MLCVVIKEFGSWGEGPLRHDPIFQKGERLCVMSVDQDGNATITHENGEVCGYTVPMEYLSVFL